MDDAPAVTIRRAELRDVRDIMTIDARSFPAPWSEQLTIQEITLEGRVHFVAVADHRVVGHAGIAILAGDAHVTTIAVHEDQRGKGVGGLLLDEIFSAARTSGCRALTLEVRVGNVQAIAFYESRGMTRAGIRPGYYGDTGEDAVIMWSPEL